MRGKRMRKYGAANRVELGRLGEQKANEYLLGKHYTILEQNWRCRSGEIDIIAQINSTIVFIEVRTRRNTNHFGSAGESINLRKQKQVRETAQVYLHFTKQYDSILRFDVITVLWSDDDTGIQIDHICDAF